MDFITAELVWQENLSQHYKVVTPYLFEISALFRIRSQTTEEER